MNPRVTQILGLLQGDREADRAVPPTGFTARLTVFTAAAMAFLAVFALALSVATGRLADRWSAELARTATLRISAPAGEGEAQVRAALQVLETTPGVASARALTPEEQAVLLEPWFGPDLPLETLPIPRLIEVTADADGYDATGLRARLQAEVPAAVLDDHTRWRAPLVDAANRLRTLGWIALLLIGGAVAAMITLAAQSALSANAQVIRVMRLVGARDAYIARAFVRRFTLRAGLGALVGTILGLLAVAALPNGDDGGFLTGLGFSGAGWFLPLFIPPLAAVVAFLATRAAALRTLRTQA
ncbi:cell division transport system permease protein [Loktanella sp. DSM 29012]|uniref:FtsX-like permease family protein n=1 Tax=Loktanella gaetbuli TaxID=2881335 RepID=A0ABS8BVY8_9RHOB|nr:MULTISPECIES: FtsX-like permease family protein [Loktanella]MCB5199869.1 FtsX-like permease family protein [Loktanella gaetbuli]SEQ45008.1 cell division transport system permease protein [Loktanella sp. DSM 29012]